MNRHPPPPGQRIVLLRTTTDIFKQTTSIFSTQNNLPTLLFLSFILLFGGLIAEDTTNALTSHIDNEPSIKSFFQTHRPPNPTSPTTAITTSRRHRHQLTPVGTLDDDFITGDDKLDRFFGSLHKPQSNATRFTLDFFDPQFFNFVSDDGIRASETVRSIDEINDSVPINQTDDSHDFTSLSTTIATCSVSYGSVIAASIVTHSLVHGIIFLLVLNHFRGKYNEFVETYVNGCLLGFFRSIRFIAMRLGVRIVLTQIFGVFFFGEIEDRYYFTKIFVWLLLLPYSLFTTLDRDFEKVTYGFVLPWLIFDSLLSFVLSVDVWIVMADPRKKWKTVVKEGVRLLSLMIFPAIIIKCYENIVCGPFARWLLARTFGDLFAIVFLAFMEVYFMVAWMVYYLSVKSIDANSRGQRFGQQELEAMIEGVI